MIQARGIRKRFDKLEILKGIDLTIDAGEIVAIVGPSGAGKTTLLQIIGTLDKPDSGTLLIEGIEPFRLNEKQMADFRNRHIGFVFQFHQLLPEFTALENVMIPALIARQPTSAAEKRAKELLDFLKLSDRMTHKPAELSGGEKQRVAVARALVNRPSVILADEPSGSLDTQNKEELHARRQIGRAVHSFPHELFRSVVVAVMVSSSVSTASWQGDSLDGLDRFCDRSQY